MGAQESYIKYEGPPDVLEARDIPSLVKYMQSDRCKNVFVMAGAGASTSAGIPDFRSPGTGLYSNLARLNLPFPEAVFDISFFRENPVPFYTLAKELLPGHFRPTITHSFVRLLHEHSLLRMCFTQNIDTLERRAGVPGRLLIEAHGSFANQHCINCHVAFDDDEMRECLLTGKIAHCDVCGGLIKPDIVFFGEALPDSFHASIPKLRTADLLFVIGTSLTVQPFASLATMIPDSCPRVLVNLDSVGDFGSRPDDVLCLGKCDDVVRDIARGLGWERELEKLWDETAASVEYPPEKPAVAPAAVPEEKEEKELEKEIEEITTKIEHVLNTQEEEKALEREKSEALSTGEKEPVIADKMRSNTGVSSETLAVESKAVPAAKAKPEAAVQTKAEPAAEAKAGSAVEERFRPTVEAEVKPVEVESEPAVEAKFNLTRAEKVEPEYEPAEEDTKLIIEPHAKLVVEPKAGPLAEGEVEPAVQVKIVNEPVVELVAEHTAHKADSALVAQEESLPVVDNEAGAGAESEMGLKEKY